MIVALFGILGLLNYAAAQAPVRIDLTAAQQFTLSEQTKSVLRQVQAPVQVEAFFTPSQAEAAFQAQYLLHEFSVENTNITFRLIDPEVQPGAAIQRGAQAGDVVFLSEGRQEKTSEPSERAFSTALLQVTGKELKTVCFLQGHGEPSITDQANVGYDVARVGLEQENYLVQPFNSSTTDNPASINDCSVLVIAGPKQDINEQEMQLLSGYLNDHGKAVLLLEPTTPESFRQLLRPWSVVLGTNVVIDPGNRSDLATAIVPPEMLAQNEVTRGLDVTVFPQVTDLILAGDPAQGPIREYLAYTRPETWLETGDAANPTFDEGADEQGPIPIAARIQSRPGPEETEVSRLIVFGDSDFARNDFFYTRSNVDLFLNSVNWVADQEFLISVRPKPSPFRVLLLTEAQWRFVLISTVGLLPLAVGLAGGVAWWLRR
jgi:ABC-type uncharacterized transport system involved in gliding motility auxiliary subunit